jgi:DNA repair protein RecO (recombination protein O)
MVMDTARQRLYRAEGVVIRHATIGEADKIITLYTPRHGKLRAVAKGVRRPESHLGGNVELFVRVNTLIARGRNLDIITQAETLDAFKGLRTELPVIQTTFYLGELLDGLTEEGLPNEPLYALLLECLAALAGGHDPESVARYYELRLLTLLGYRLEVEHCVHCGRPLEPVPNLFSAEAGGVLCPACGAADPTARALSVNALKVLRLVGREPLAALLRYRLSPALQAELEAVGHAGLRPHLERDPRSWALIAAARAERP